MSDILIAYYSRKGENYWDGQIISLAKGNTEAAAEMIQKAVGGELFEIDTVKTYSADYTTCTQQAHEEFRAQARPELKRYPESLDKFDTVFVGYPSWWGTCPMAVFTFLEHFDLSGKTVIPFCTNEGSGMGNSERDLAKVCKGAALKKGLSVRGCKVMQSEAVIADWAKKSL